MQWLFGLGPSDWAAIGSVAVAMVSLMFNWLIVRRQSEMQIEALRLQADGAVFAWGRECVETISRAIEYADHAPAENAGAIRSDLRWHLSALIDQGRMFFPNEATGDYVSRSEVGRNPGWRPAVLDAEAFAYFVIRDEDKLGSALEERGSFLRECRRLLYTEIQRATDPRRRARMLGRLADRSQKQAKNDFQHALATRINGMLPGVLDRFRPPTGSDGASPPA